MKVLETLMAGLRDEFTVAFNEPFGTDTEGWNEIKLWTALERVIAQAAARFTVGLPLCESARLTFPCVVTSMNHC